MGSDPRHSLQQSIEELAQTMRTQEDIQSVSLKLDVLASELLATPLVTEKLGAERVEEMIGTETDADEILREIGGEEFAAVARPTTELLELSRSSLVDLITDSDVPGVDEVRQELYGALEQILPLLDRKG